MADTTCTTTIKGIIMKTTTNDPTDRLKAALAEQRAEPSDHHQQRLADAAMAYAMLNDCRIDQPVLYLIARLDELCTEAMHELAEGVRLEQRRRERAEKRRRRAAAKAGGNLHL